MAVTFAIECDYYLLDFRKIHFVKIVFSSGFFKLCKTLAVRTCAVIVLLAIVAFQNISVQSFEFSTHNYKQVNESGQLLITKSVHSTGKKAQFVFDWASQGIKNITDIKLRNKKFEGAGVTAKVNDGPFLQIDFESVCEDDECVLGNGIDMEVDIYGFKQSDWGKTFTY